MPTEKELRQFMVENSETAKEHNQKLINVFSALTMTPGQKAEFNFEQHLKTCKECHRETHNLCVTGLELFGKIGMALLDEMLGDKK